MKKFTFLFIVILFLSQCQIGPQEAKAQESIGAGTYASDHPAYTWTIQRDGITYRVFTYGTGYNSAGIAVINVSKDKLEMDKLKLETEKLQLEIRKLRGN